MIIKERISKCKTLYAGSQKLSLDLICATIFVILENEKINYYYCTPSGSIHCLM